VSFNDSPLSTDEPLAFSVSVSAERRFAASSNDELVRVDGQWLFARREVVGVGGYVAGDGNKDREFPGHPGRLVR